MARRTIDEMIADLAIYNELYNNALADAEETFAGLESEGYSYDEALDSDEVIALGREADKWEKKAIKLKAKIAAAEARQIASQARKEKRAAEKMERRLANQFPSPGARRGIGSY